MSLQNISKSAVRVGKNYIKGYSDVQVKVRDATSNDPWGPSGTQMNELAQLSYNQNEFIEMMEILDKRLNDKGKNWRHVFKSLTLLDYLLHAGSENVVIYFRDNIYIVKTLKEFQYIDENGKDQGANVRQKAKDITNLLQDEARLRDERRSRSHMRDRMSNGPDDDDDASQRRRAERERNRRQPGNEDDELRRAIEESKRMAREEQNRIRAEAKDEEELQRALALSKKEEEERIKALEEANKNALFDDSINLDGPNAYTQNQQVDFFGNPLVDTSGGQGYGVQPQYTSFNPYMQMQPTGYNPFLQNQLQQQELMQQQYMQQQQAEYQRQLELQQAAVQYQNMMTQQQQQQPIQPQPTSFGSNNPWLQSSGGQQPQQQHNVPVGDLFSSAPTPPPVQQVPQPVQQPQQPPQMSPQQQNRPIRAKVNDDGRYNELNRLLAMGDGVDTFGNTGDMRMGPNMAQYNQMRAQRTGMNFNANTNQNQNQGGNGGGDAANNPFFKV
ncbi:related to ENT2 - clathrin binding protein, required for endocytosis [Melanopsichium pennsylvanicum]|uniref:Related to ENT2 - clathrin binding protein, required for endocytosis n=2 Tax=Melanopsichium pennsylvanicum TaxID=63383 RepID=A0AAJ4XNB7_9BASI|nr:related to ENT2-clathrin binding protein, required for endocytosis [Melanopsichium pennsylvanicum 4]SNX86079.1 related to ENT2 - clathrin binding protein, required for endocytosis [Melanopsichium pennsylvanicum]